MNLTENNTSKSQLLYAGFNQDQGIFGTFKYHNKLTFSLLMLLSRCSKICLKLLFYFGLGVGGLKFPKYCP